MRNKRPPGYVTKVVERSFVLMVFKLTVSPEADSADGHGPVFMTSVLTRIERKTIQEQRRVGQVEIGAPD